MTIAIIVLVTPLLMGFVVIALANAQKDDNI